MNDRRPFLRLVGEDERAPERPRKPSTRRRKEYAKIEVWRNPESEQSFASPSFVADANVIDEPVYANQRETAALLAAEQWRLSAQSQYTSGADRYTYSVAWDADAEEFVATVAEFPEFVERGATQMEALWSLIVWVGTNVHQLRIQRLDVPEPGSHLDEDS